MYCNLLSEKLDFVGRFENLMQDWEMIRSKLAKDPGPLPLHRKTAGAKRKHYSKYYDDTTRETVAKIYAEDIKRFGYVFET